MSTSGVNGGSDVRESDGRCFVGSFLDLVTYDDRPPSTSTICGKLLSKTSEIREHLINVEA